LAAPSVRPEVDRFADLTRNYGREVVAMTIKHTAHLRVKGDAIEQFRERVSRHAKTSLADESGCYQFDVYQDLSDETLFLLIETYENEPALEVHRNSPHYKAFRSDVADWVTERIWWYWQSVE